MSRRRAYKQETIDCQQRFFEALQVLVNGGSLPGGISGFCETYGIDRRHLYTQRKDMGKGFFEVAWIIPLIKFFKVNATWLLLGKGKMFRGLPE